MILNKEHLLTRQKHWDSFNSWESTFLTTSFEPNLNNLLIWFNEAWKLAREQNPDWINQEIDRDKLLQLQKTRDAFSKLGRIS
jgi:hypothetical protein